MMYLLPILLADNDFGICIQIVVVLLFVVVPILLKAFGGSARQPDRTPAQRRRPKPTGAEMSSNRPPGDADIEEFLRRAEAKRRGGQAGRTGAVRPRPQPQRQPVANPFNVAPQDELEIVEAEVVAQPVPMGAEDQMESRFESSINTTDFDQRAERLGDRVEHADDAMEARLQTVFDHGLGDLSKTPATVATVDVTPAPEDAASTVGKATTAAPSAASRIAQRMRSPQGMREAVVLREILERPEHRW
jgi:hypothetical protein